MPTERQREYAEAVREHGSARAAARALGINHHPILRAMRNHPALFDRGKASGFPAGSVAHYWHKSKDENGGGISAFVKVDQRLETLKEIAEALAADLPRLAPIAEPSTNAASLANLYTLTDAHVGMLAWAKETGATWNVGEARRVLGGCFADMIHRAPTADIGIVAVLGDWLHYDGFEAVTPTNRHILDNDTRFPKLVDVGTALLRQVLDAALTKHARVIAVISEGNHDPASSVWMRVLLTALYEAEPRLRVLQGSTPFHAYQHGETMLCWHHGHTVKPGELPSIFAAEYAPIWGATRHRYFHCGHRHHRDEKEHRGGEVIQHPTLSARDAYAARHGYRSMRRAIAITYHETHGEVGRITTTPEMLPEPA